MTHPNLDIINKFFDAYAKRDMDELKRVLADNAKWTFLWQILLAGSRTVLMK